MNEDRNEPRRALELKNEVDRQSSRREHRSEQGTSEKIKEKKKMEAQKPQEFECMNTHAQDRFRVRSWLASRKQPIQRIQFIQKIVLIKAK